MMESEMKEVNASQDEIDEVIQSRQEAWQVFFNVTALGQGDLDE